MSKLKGAFVFPHPPIIVPEVGKGQQATAQRTIDAAEEAAARIARLAPDTILVITPHGNMLADAVTVSADPVLEGSFAGFGAPQVKLQYQNDLELMEKILDKAEERNLLTLAIDSELRKTYRFDKNLDHGALVPLYFINKAYSNFKLVHITYSMLPHEEQYRFGMAIREAIEGLGRDTVVICSGDLSHRLTKDAPAGHSPKGAVFDAAYVELLRQGDVDTLLNIDCDLVDGAGECGLRSTVMLFGILEGCHPEGEILSYEGPYGVGYCIAQLHFDCKEVVGEDAYVRLARASLEEFIRNGEPLMTGAELPKELLKNRAGVFVSLKKHGELRGCIGTISPTTGSIAEEIVQNAVSAGTSDPRFYPVEEQELEELQYSVDVLMKAEPIEGMHQLDVKRYGLIVRSGRKSGLLLPNLEGVDTVEEQLDITLQKAGIAPTEKYTMERFEVIRHK